MAEKVTAPANFTPLSAIAYGDEGTDAVPVSMANPLPMIQIGPDGQEIETETGGVSGANSTQAALAAGEEFVGAWEVNNFEHSLVKIAADQPGTAFLEFGVVREGVTGEVVADADIVQRDSLATVVYANVSSFRPLVKGAGRAFRVRYINGPATQVMFTVFTTYGSNLFPPSVSADNELLVITREGLQSSFVSYGAFDISAPTYAILVDLSDTIDFPHDNSGSIEFSAIYLTFDRQNTAQGTLQLGIITRIDGTSADITYIAGVGFEKSASTSVTRDRNFAPSRIKCQVQNGKLSRYSTNFIANGVTAVNTGLTLASPEGPVTPAVGDAIMFFDHTSGGSYDPAVSAIYLTER